MKTIYRITIQDGENEYDLFRENCPKLEKPEIHSLSLNYRDVNEELVDNFTRAIKKVEKLKVSEQELNTLRNLRVV